MKHKKIKNCVFCGKEFEGTDYRKYCSPYCRNEAGYNNFTKICTICGKEFHTNSNKIEYCSLGCRKIYYKNRYNPIKNEIKEKINIQKDLPTYCKKGEIVQPALKYKNRYKKYKKICVICQKEFYTDSSKREWCSTECLNFYNKLPQNKYYDKNEYRKNRPIKNCPVCNKEFQSSKKCCSDECKKKYQKQQRKKYVNQNNSYSIANKIKTNIRRKLKELIHNTSKSMKIGKNIDLLGCTINEYKIYLENLFQEGMTWENYGLHGWQIDHIIPCDNFDLSDLEEQKKCFHYTNTQPLWAKDNIKKGNKLDWKKD
jgi:predicted nucleic acid-binding Zn ribbon protein